MPTKLKILTIENKKEEEILRKKSEKIETSEIKSVQFQEFLDDLIFTAQNHIMDEGWITAGLAAIQVGKPISVFVVLNTETNLFEEYINPEIEYVGNIQELEAEGCLSLPGKQADIRRHRKIKVKYLDREGNPRVKKIEDFSSKVIQHEYDHLQGILFLDKLTE